MNSSNLLYRTQSSVTQDVKGRKLNLSFSSNKPVKRFFGTEILGHSEDNVDLEWFNSGSAPLLLDHDPSKQIGVIESASVDGSRATANVRLGDSPLAREIYADIEQGIRKCISVGYRYDMKAAKLQENADDDTYLVERWQPMEISVVSIPADSSVGIGRSLNFNRNNNMNEIKQEKDNAAEILDLAGKHSKSDLGIKAVKEGLSLEQFKAMLLEELRSEALSAQQPSSIGMSKSESREFSIIRAINASITGSWESAGLEREASRAAAAKLGRDPAGFFVPGDVMGARTLEKQSPESAGVLVPAEYLSSSFIDMLRNKMVVSQLGARILSGLEGDISIPKQVGGGKAFWVAESAEPEESNQKFGQVAISPKTLAAYTDFSRKLILQASPDIEYLVRSDLATTLALEIDRAAIMGSGQGSEPKGILSYEEIARIDGSNMDNMWSVVVGLETALAAENADLGNMAYLCDARVRGLLKTAEKSASTAQFIWQEGAGSASLNGIRAFATNQMPSGCLMLGNFADLIIGHWGALDVLVDPYSLGKSGGVRIRLMQDIDIAIRHAESFAVATGADSTENKEE